MYYRELKEKYKVEARDFAHEDELTNILSSMFTYENMDEVNTEFIELYLLAFGSCAVWKVDGVLSVTYGYRAGTLDVNGRGKDLICITGNGKSKTFNDFAESDEVVFFQNNNYATPDLNVEHTAYLLSELDKSVAHCIINSRYTNFVEAPDDVTKNAVEKMIETNEVGKPNVVVSKTPFRDEVGKIDVINVTDVTNTDKIQYLSRAIDDVYRQFYNKYGIEMCTTTKLAQQTKDEVSNGHNARFILPFNRLAWRKRAIDEVNTKFGLSASVDFSECWKRELAKDETPEDSEEEKEIEESEAEVETEAEENEESGEYGNA